MAKTLLEFHTARGGETMRLVAENDGTYTVERDNGCSVGHPKAPDGVARMVYNAQVSAAIDGRTFYLDTPTGRLPVKVDAFVNAMDAAMAWERGAAGLPVFNASRHNPSALALNAIAQSHRE